MQKEMDYLFILKALQEIPFGVGKKLLIQFLQGKEEHKSISRNQLHRCVNFGCLAYERTELEEMINHLVLNGLIKMTSVNGKQYWKVLELSDKGRREIDNPSLYKKKLSFNYKESKTKITDEDRKLFASLGSYLEKYNDPQKKAIISDKKHLLCIAGAGSGKTTVLTKRIEFLVKYRSVPPTKILAITFTRKARKEMMTRLAKMGDYGSLQDVQVETFNSFCEKILRQYNDLVYEKPVRVITYKDKIIMIKKAVAKLNMSLSTAIDNYFSFAQKRGKMEEQLANIFMNDCFFLRDYCKFKNNSLDKKRAQDNFTGKMVFAVCNFIEAHMKKQGLRDFADQLLDAIALFEKRPDLLPEYEHILIDEYQDVNSTQIKLVDLLAAPNLFAVGDPRQSIFGWRGSDVKYILQFEEKYPQCETVTLTKNYRSSKHIVNLVNESIRNMRLADLESPLDGKKDIHLLTFNSEESESEFVIQRILASELPRNEIFVLARTNRQLNELSQRMRVRRIRHVVRSDEMKNSIMAGEDEITLATIHAIKGMEAELVFVIGCHGINFPCKGSEHPVMELVDIEEYDKEEEERRLFYVAMSRAKNSLYLSYSGAKPTYFITDKMLGMIEENEVKVKPVSLVKKSGVSNPSTDVLSRLKEWRTEMSRQLGVAPYMIMHDKTMFDIVEKVPMTKVELESVYGMGPMKIKKYGEELLRVVGG